ncbi:hypothetical protein D3C83_177680 [compost metagenome]
MIGAIAQSKLAKQGARLVETPVPGQGSIDRRDFHILFRRGGGEQIVALEDKAEGVAP